MMIITLRFGMEDRINQSSRREFLTRTAAAGAGLALGSQIRGVSRAAPASELQIPVRHYQIAQMYGPGMPPSGREGLHRKTLVRPPSHVGLVLVHIWNVGEPDGPYPIEPGERLPGEAGDWVPRAHRIVREKIAPVLHAARDAGLGIFHVAQHAYADRYPQYREISEDPELNPDVDIEYERCVRPRTVEEIWNHEYGPRYPGPIWRTHEQKFDIAEVVRPLPDEAVVLTGHQLNGLCRRRGIDTLLYAGFMADICLMEVSGALKEMADKFRYTCVALRDCTTAYEFEETYDQMWMTFAAIRRVEQEYGFSATAEDVVEACRAST